MAEISCKFSIGYYTMVMIHSVDYGDVDNVKKMINDHQIDPASQNNQAFRHANENDHVQIINLILDYQSVWYAPLDKTNSYVYERMYDSLKLLLLIIYSSFNACQCEHISYIIVVICKCAYNLKLISKLYPLWGIIIDEPNNCCGGHIGEKNIK